MSSFGTRYPGGYCEKEDVSEKVDTAMLEDKGESYLPTAPEHSGRAYRWSRTAGGPFSALTPSKIPQDILSELARPEDRNCHPGYRFDEFGFRVKEGDGPEQSSNKLLRIPFVENQQDRLRWVAQFNLTQNIEGCDISWDKVEVRLTRTKKLRSLVQDGIPHSLRPQIWMRLSGALQKKLTAKMSYEEVVRKSNNDALLTSKQIEKDLLRTMPENACFSHHNSIGIPGLRRILRSVAFLNPDIGYCQGTGMIAASLLLLMEEEDAFWMMCTIIEDILPASYYSSTMTGIQTDQHVLRSLIPSYLPDVDVALRTHDMDLSLITSHWFLTLFASMVHMKVLLRIWDLLFLDGSIVLFQVTLGMLKKKVPDLRHIGNSVQLYNAISDIPGHIDDINQVSMEVAASLNDLSINIQRCRHLTNSVAGGGDVVSNHEAAIDSAGSSNFQNTGKKDSKEMAHTTMSKEGESYLPVASKENRWCPAPGDPFSAITPSMWSQDILNKLQQQKSRLSYQSFIRYDEFGFHMDGKDGPDQSFNGLKFFEKSHLRSQWMTYLCPNIKGCDPSWDKVQVLLTRTKKLRSLILDGIPHSFRPQIWMRLSGALQKKLSSDMKYTEVVKASSNDALMTSKQIEKDLLRIMPGNACFSHHNSIGIPRLRRILRSIALLYPDIGYFQGIGIIAASLLLLMEEEDVFWMMRAIVDDFLPQSYYSSTLRGIQVDQHVLRSLISTKLPDVDTKLRKHCMDLSLITSHWFLTLFASVVHMKTLLRIWDLFFFDGSIVLFQVTLGMLKKKEPDLWHIGNSVRLYNAISDIPGHIDNLDQVPSLTQESVDILRTKYSKALEAGGSSEALMRYPIREEAPSLLTRGWRMVTGLMPF